MQEDLDHAAQLTDEYEVLRHDFEELQDAHEKVQVRGSLALGVRSLVLNSASLDHFFDWPRQCDSLKRRIVCNHSCRLPGGPTSYAGRCHPRLCSSSSVVCAVLRIGAVAWLSAPSSSGAAACMHVPVVFPRRRCTMLGDQLCIPGPFFCLASSI